MIRDLITTFIRSYLEQVRWFRQTDDDSTFSLNLDTARGAVLSALQDARLSTRDAMLDRTTHVDESDRRFRDTTGVRRLDRDRVRQGQRRIRGLPADHPEVEEIPRSRL